MNEECALSDTPEVLPTHMESVRLRYSVRSAENQWRGVQRDAVLGVAFLLWSGMLAAGAAALVAPIPLLFLAFKWMQHDQRIGSNARYLRDIVEPALGDGLEGYEDYLDRSEPDRSYVRRFSPSSVVMRLFFPTLQGSLLLWGLYHAAVHTTDIPHWLIGIASGVGFSVILLTLVYVKHVRVPAEPGA